MSINVQDQIKAAGLLHHEDIEVGKPYLSETETVSKDEILAFGRAYDPQPMHVDEEAAKATLAGGLCASGYHICGIMMRLVARSMLNRMTSLGAPGIDEVKWMKPLRPGDVVHVAFTAREKRVLASRPDVGLSKVSVELIGADGAPIASWLTNQLLRMRTPAPAPAQTSEKRSQRAAPVNFWQDGGAVIPCPPDLYFEDREIGETFDLPGASFSKEDILAFARQFDPQPFHLDEEAARKSLFGGLAASGWQTCAFYIRGLVGARQKASAEARAKGIKLAAYGPSPGFKNLSWAKPMFVGDSIAFRSRLVDKIDLKSRPNRGLLIIQSQGRNQKGEVVFGITSQILAERREPFRP